MQIPLSVDKTESNLAPSEMSVSDVDSDDQETRVATSESSGDESDPFDFITVKYADQEDSDTCDRHVRNHLNVKKC